MCGNDIPPVHRPCKKSVTLYQRDLYGWLLTQLTFGAFCRHSKLERPCQRKRGLPQRVQPGRSADLLHHLPHCITQPGLSFGRTQRPLLCHLLFKELEAGQKVASPCPLHGLPLDFLRLGRRHCQALEQDSVLPPQTQADFRDLCKKVSAKWSHQAGHHQLKATETLSQQKK